MSSLKLTDGAVTNGVLVLGLAFNPNKASALTIESGTVTIDTRTLLAQLKELGATGKSDEVIKIPGTRTKLILFTGLGIASNNYSHETLRRAAAQLHGHLLEAVKQHLPYPQLILHPLPLSPKAPL